MTEIPLTAPLLTIQEFQVRYPNQGTWAVAGVDLTLRPGDILGLVGESGCGKSTLGRAALRLVPRGTTLKGTATFEGRSILDFTPGELRHFRGEAVSLVFQDPMTRLDPLMTIGDHCVETLRPMSRSCLRRRPRRDRWQPWKAVNIPPDRWGQYPHEFSGGMRQRVAIALALVLEPQTDRGR
jgi:peptide/nickel transport system ATP-binding protein